MKTFLMYRQKCFKLDETLAPHVPDLAQDLEVETVLNAMSGGNKFLHQVATSALFSSLVQPDEILHRQAILADCLDNPELVRRMYGVVVEAILQQQKIWTWMASRYPSGALRSSLDGLRVFLTAFRQLKPIVTDYDSRVRSEGLRSLFRVFAQELNEEYLATVEGHLHRLTFPTGIYLSAQLDPWNKGDNYALHKPIETQQSWLERLRRWLDRLLGKDSSAFSFEIGSRDEAGYRILSEITGRGISRTAIALAKSTDHILQFFRTLQAELGFYMGCINLRDQLVRRGAPICFPEPMPSESDFFSSRNLYDISLVLTKTGRVVGNDLGADGKRLVMITGTNQGGKTTFLRSLGLAQLMMQCGMFVTADSFRASTCNGVFSHFKREEDANMKSGKLDEELHRMSSIIDSMKPHSLILLNESFSSTNEREGSEIARQVVRALLDNHIKVIYVTHMFDLAQGFYAAGMPSALFLRPERLADGSRTFRILEDVPLPTSFGKDLFVRIFGESGQAGMRANS